MTETTTIRVSKKTAEALEGIRENLKAESIDDAIQSLIKRQRKAALEQMFGAGREKLTRFTEEDRGEDRN